MRAGTYCLVLVGLEASALVSPWLDGPNNLAQAVYPHFAHS